MKIFIAGARALKDISPLVKDKLMNICSKDHSVLVGDCYGIDASVQRFFHQLNYVNVTVYASNGKARNNIGNWMVESVFVPSTVKGFDFYKQKDIAMANNADCGFMIWDGKSKGTLNNMINLISQNKEVVVYMSTLNNLFYLKNFDELNGLVNSCGEQTQKTYMSLSGHAIPVDSGFKQLSFM